MKVNISKATTFMIVIAVLLYSFSNSVHAFSFPSEKFQVKYTEMERVDKLYAKPNATGDGDCSSWANACSLQHAIELSGTIKYIWVAAGTHNPTTTNDRTISFVIKDGVTIYGGFPSEGGVWDDRDWTLYPTILSGDIGTGGVQTDNSYHVVITSGVTDSAVLDGFTITGGYTDDYGPGEYDWLGAGILNVSGSPTLINLIITGNNSTDLSGGSGAGMYNKENSNPNLTNVTFSNNAAASGAGMYSENSSPVLSSVTFSYNNAHSCGGGMQIEGGSPSLTNVIFDHNSATGNMAEGGGMYNLYDTTVMLTNVTFTNNSAYKGGGISNSEASPTLNNVTFSGNSAQYGGAISNTHGSPTITNVTIVGNIASIFGGGLFSQTGYFGSSHPTLTSSIVWGNLPATQQVWNDGSSSATITYSDIEGGWAGTGNINLNPLLGSLADNGGFSKTHALFHGSPAIDSGNPVTFLATDQRGFARPYDGDGNGVALPDMGAYESEFKYGVFLPAVLR